MQQNPKASITSSYKSRRSLPDSDPTDSISKKQERNSTTTSRRQVNVKNNSIAFAEEKEERQKQQNHLFIPLYHQRFEQNGELIAQEMKSINVNQTGESASNQEVIKNWRSLPQTPFHGQKDDDNKKPASTFHAHAILQDRMDRVQNKMKQFGIHPANNQTSSPPGAPTKSRRSSLDFIAKKKSLKEASDGISQVHNQPNNNLASDSNTQLSTTTSPASAVLQERMDRIQNKMKRYDVHHSSPSSSLQLTSAHAPSPVEPSSSIMPQNNEGETNLQRDDNREIIRNWKTRRKERQQQTRARKKQTQSGENESLQQQEQQQRFDNNNTTVSNNEISNSNDGRHQPHGRNNRFRRYQRKQNASQYEYNSTTSSKPGAVRVRGINHNDNSEGEEDNDDDTIFYSVAAENDEVSSRNQNDSNDATTRVEQHLALNNNATDHRHNRHDEPTMTKWGNKKWQRLCCILILVAILVALGIGLGVGFGIGAGRTTSSPNVVPSDQTNEAAPLAPFNATLFPPCMFRTRIPLPTIFESCACLGIPGNIPTTAQTLQQQVTTVINDIYINANVSLPVFENCHHNNLALHWLMDDIQQTNNTNVNSWKNRYLLASIYSFWTDGGRNEWTNSSGWLSSDPECTWARIECLESTESVVSLELFDNGIVSSNDVGIPLEVYLLNELKILGLGSNGIGGTISNEISLLSHLEILDLESAQIMGTIPESLYSLTNLNLLKLGNNNLKGSLSVLIGSLTNLKKFDAAVNSFTDGLPTEIGLLTNLRDFQYKDNPLSRGRLPSEIGLLSQLTSLDLTLSALIGPIPSELGRLVNLTALGLGKNNFNGTLPTEIGMLENLQFFFVEDGGLSGTLPTEIGQMTSLLRLRAGSQAFTGTIPSEIGKLSILGELSLKSTWLTGTLPTEFGMMSELNTLDLNNVQVHGTIPTEFNELTERLCFDFRRTLLEGEIPMDWCGTVLISCRGSRLDCDCCRECSGTAVCSVDL